MSERACACGVKESVTGQRHHAQLVWKGLLGMHVVQVSICTCCYTQASQVSSSDCEAWGSHLGDLSLGTSPWGSHLGDHFLQPGRLPRSSAFKDPCSVGRQVECRDKVPLPGVRGRGGGSGGGSCDSIQLGWWAIRWGSGHSGGEFRAFNT